MKRPHPFLILICCILSNMLLTSIHGGTQPQKYTRAITYKKPGTRLGDRLLAYTKAKWVSVTEHIPFLNKNFKYADQLYFSHAEEKYKKYKTKHLPKISVNGLKQTEHQFLTIEYSQEALYIVGFSFAPTQWQQYEPLINTSVLLPYNITYTDDYYKKGKNEFKVRFNHLFFAIQDTPGFRTLLREALKPIAPQIPMTKPNMINVAVHVRTGSGRDGSRTADQLYSLPINLNRYTHHIQGNTEDYSSIRTQRAQQVRTLSPTEQEHNDKHEDKRRPVKFPPDQYYIDQIKAISHLYHDVPLYVHIFTDDCSPEAIAQRYQHAINKDNITFGYRKKGNMHDANVVEDMYAMSTFNILIRPYSSFSQIAQLIGNHQLVIAPYHSVWCGNTLIIDEVIIFSQ